MTLDPTITFDVLAAMGTETRRCTGPDCQRMMPVGEFTRNPLTGRGYAPRCKECRAKYQKTYHDAKRRVPPLKTQEEADLVTKRTRKLLYKPAAPVATAVVEEVAEVAPIEQTQETWERWGLDYGDDEEIPVAGVFKRPKTKKPTKPPPTVVPQGYQGKGNGNGRTADKSAKRNVPVKSLSSDELRTALARAKVELARWPRLTPEYNTCGSRIARIKEELRARNEPLVARTAWDDGPQITRKAGTRL